MEQVERIGISLNKKLLADFDSLIRKKGCRNRSQAVADIITRQLSEQRLDNPNTKAVAAVSFIYDHHRPRLTQRLTNLQHSHFLHTICAMHIHLDAHNCLEIVVLRGRLAHIKQNAEQLLSQKGVRLGKVTLLTPELSEDKH